MDQETTEIEELKQEVEELRAVTEDTNKVVHKIRRGARWGLFFQIIWWLTIFGVTGAAYYYYLQPYVVKIENMYFKTQQSAAQAQNFWQQIGQTIGSYLNAPTSTQP
jgi:uncharacterized membrane protein